MKWRLNKIQYPVYNLGEGKRIGIWVQGCNLRCKGCLNRTLWNKKGGRSVPVDGLFNWIISINENFDGITISGGEPFQQYEQLIVFMHLIKSKTRLTIHCFTGYYLTELEVAFPDRMFLKYIDVLVDGRYEKELHENMNLRGSSNQTIYRIINELPVKQENIKASAKWSVNVNEKGEIHMSGIPRENELNKLCDDLAEAGIHKKFK
jgi:anaerobic ribonucleoside-triphosphate reductase activating protein